MSNPEDALDGDDNGALLTTLARGTALPAPFALVPLVDRTELVELDRAILPFVDRGVTFGANDVLRAAAAAVVEEGASRAVDVDVDADDEAGGRATGLFGLAVAINDGVRDAILGLGLGSGALIDGLGVRLALGAATVAVPACFAPVVNLADTGVILGAEVPVAFTVDTLLIDEEACRAGVRVDAENMD